MVASCPHCTCGDCFPIILSLNVGVLAGLVGRSVKHPQLIFEVLSYDASSGEHVVDGKYGKEAMGLLDDMFKGCYVVPKGGALVGM